MDLGDIYEVLSSGKMISKNSSEYGHYWSMLYNPEDLKKFSDAVSVLGFNLISENGYIYLSKKVPMKEKEIEDYINKHKKIIVAVSVLRQIEQSIDVSEFLIVQNFFMSMQEYIDDDPTIKERLNFISEKEDEYYQVEELFDLLARNKVIERLHSENKYRILAALDYYINLVLMSEYNEEEE